MFGAGASLPALTGRTRSQGFEHRGSMRWMHLGSGWGRRLMCSRMDRWPPRRPLLVIVVTIGLLSRAFSSPSSSTCGTSRVMNCRDHCNGSTRPTPSIACMRISAYTTPGNKIEKSTLPHRTKWWSQLPLLVFAPSSRLCRRSLAVSDRLCSATIASRVHRGVVRLESRKVK